MLTKRLAACPFECIQFAANTIKAQNASFTNVLNCMCMYSVMAENSFRLANTKI